MTDLPNSDDPQGQTPPPIAPPAGVSVVSSGNKEFVGGMDRPEGLQDVGGHEIELPKEVSQAGVRIQPTTIPIPPAVAQMGVRPAGNNIPVAQPTPSVALPITDDQIAAGLHESVVHSWRWLSEWCVKRLKQIHMAIQSSGGKNIRVKI
jgi:hypothetical protein